MRILMPVDGSSFSKAAVAFVASRATLLEEPTDLELVNIQYRVPLRAARALGKEAARNYHETEAARALNSAAAALERVGAKTTARHVELAVSVQSGLAGQADIAVGNIVGSNIFNLLFILGVSALIVPLAVSQQLVRLDVPLMIGASASVQ